MITKTITLSGSAEDSFEAAVAAILARAGETIDAIDAYRIIELGGDVDDSGVPTYAVTLEISFAVKESVSHP